MLGNRLPKFLFWIVAILITFFSCIDETFESNRGEGYLSIRLNSTTQSETRSLEGIQPGEYPDNIVRTLRVFAFDPNDNNKVISNVRYSIINSALDVVEHPITLGTYNFVFLANEHIDTDLTGITHLSDLESITYPQEAFASDELIPMIQKITNVEIVSNGQAILHDGMLNIHGIETLPPSDTPLDILTLKLDRLAVRLNVTLKSEFVLTDFDGIQISNLPIAVPLFRNGGTIAHDSGTFRSYLADEFTDVSGSGWEKQLFRIVLPASYANSDQDALVLTAKFGGDKYSPSCKLAINVNDYNLPYNTWLDFEGIVKDPLEMNIKVKPWDQLNSRWETDQVYLNLSQTEVNITDFNGARITFESNAPTVRVDGVYMPNGEYKEWAGDAFNQIQWGNEWNKKHNYVYNKDTQTGSGYLDIIVNNKNDVNISGSYKIVLTARRYKKIVNESGVEVEIESLKLKRYIKVNVTQDPKGIRKELLLPTKDEPYTSAVYIGAFFRNDQVGERIIQHVFWGGWWEATVADENIQGSGNPRDWIVLSTTPSFDPKVGTRSPGEAKDYPVVPNKYRGENGHEVTGLHRIYFRIGLTSENPNPSQPRYGYINFRYVNGSLIDPNNPPGKKQETVQTSNGNEQIKSFKIFVRQGEMDDYVLNNTFGAGDNIVPALETPRSSSAIRRFSAFNVTVQDMKDKPTRAANFVQAIPATEANSNVVHVDYPTQGGALFQYGSPTEKYRRYAYYVRSLRNDEFLGSDFGGDPPNDVWAGEHKYDRDPFWVTPSGSSDIPYKDYGEVCPENYRRPNNGVEDDLSGNNTIQEAVNSEYYASLFREIPVGDAHQYIPDDEKNEDIVRYELKPISNCVMGFYADGFFDRYPIESKDLGAGGIGEGVCLDDTRAAFKGVIFFNPETYKSLFFPSAGRRNATTGGLEFSGGTGFYLTSSLGNQWETLDPEGEPFKFKNVWQLEFFYTPAAISAVPNFASSMRCVRDE